MPSSHTHTFPAPAPTSPAATHSPPPSPHPPPLSQQLLTVLHLPTAFPASAPTFPTPALVHLPGSFSHPLPPPAFPAASHIRGALLRHLRGRADRGSAQHLRRHHQRVPLHTAAARPRRGLGDTLPTPCRGLGFTTLWMSGCSPVTFGGGGALSHPLDAQHKENVTAGVPRRLAARTS